MVVSGPITTGQGWVTLQLTRDQGFSRGFLSARSVTGFLSDVYSTAADEVGKIHIIADERVQGAVFDLPEEIAKELLKQQIPPGNTISKITKLPTLQDDGPSSNHYGRFSNRDRGVKGGSRGGFRKSRGWGRDSDADDDVDEFDNRRGGRGNRTNTSRSRSSRDSGNDWLISGRHSGRSPSFGNRDRNIERMVVLEVKWITVSWGS